MLVTFSADGHYVIDVLNDPNWLWAHLTPAPTTLPSSDLRDRQLKQLTDRFARSIAIVFDGRAIPAERVEYFPPLSDDPSAIGGLEPGLMRVTGTAPAGSDTFGLAYALVVDPFPLTIRSADGKSAATWATAGELSKPIAVTGLRRMSPWQVMQLIGIVLAFVAFAVFRHKGRIGGFMNRVHVSAWLLVVLLAVGATPAAQAPVALPTPALHHVGLNVLDPAKSQQFYKTIWPQGEITTVAGLPAYKSDMYILLTKVKKPARGKWDPKEHRSLEQSALWHIGFETQTPTATLKERLKTAHATVAPMFSSDKDTGTIWRAGEMGYGRNPIVTAKMMAERAPGKPEEGGYGYFLGPDGELIEAGGGPGQTDMFNHVHFVHDKPWCAAQWYIDHLGFKKQQGRNPATRELMEVPIPQPCDGSIGPPSWPSMQQQGTLRDPRVTVSLIGTSFSWYVRPCQPGRCGAGDVKLVPSRGQVLDHIGLTYPDLDTHVPRLRREGVKILEGIHKWGDTRAAMIEDLDGMAIMLVERKEP